MKLSKHNIIFLVLGIFYAVGIVGIAIPSLRPTTLPLTPMNLLLTSGLFIWGVNQFNINFFVTAFIVFLLGYGVEVAGVQTGVLFGEYYYGKPLGWQVFNVPLIIGVNWFLLAFSASGIANRLTNKAVPKVLIASCLMVALDFVIEPVAVALDFWNWMPLSTNGEIPPKNFAVPLQNYIMWFAAAMVINSVIHWRIKQINYPLAAFIFSVQIVFFGVLNWLL